MVIKKQKLLIVNFILILIYKVKMTNVIQRNDKFFTV